MSKGKNKYLTLAGKTDDGKPVYAGVGMMCFTGGVPLELILHKFKEDGAVVDWLDYIKTALKDGHKPQTIQSRMEAALGDIYGKAYTAEVMKRARALFSQDNI